MLTGVSKSFEAKGTRSVGFNGKKRYLKFGREVCLVRTTKSIQSRHSKIYYRVVSVGSVDGLFSFGAGRLPYGNP